MTAAASISCQKKEKNNFGKKHHWHNRHQLETTSKIDGYVLGASRQIFQGPQWQISKSTTKNIFFFLLICFITFVFFVSCTVHWFSFFHLPFCYCFFCCRLRAMNVFQTGSKKLLDMHHFNSVLPSQRSSKLKEKIKLKHYWNNKIFKITFSTEF